MSLTITYLGHSGVLLEARGTRVAIDPFLTGNPVAVHDPKTLKVDAVCVTHGHSDHLGDAIPIAKASNAPLFSSWEVCEYAAEQGCSKTEPGNPGGQINTPWGFVAFVRADHSSSFQGRALGNPMGLMVSLHGTVVYHLGDTGLFSDLKLIGELYAPSLACIPVGDRFTMGPRLGTIAAEFIGAPHVLPIHYNTWPPIAQSLDSFTPRGITVHALKPGQSLELPPRGSR